jgi:hypothetical protein
MVWQRNGAVRQWSLTRANRAIFRCWLYIPLPDIPLPCIRLLPTKDMFHVDWLLM